MHHHKTQTGPWVLLAVGLVLCGEVWGSGAPSLWGYGVKSCTDFVAVAPESDAGGDLAGDAYRRYREWLAGLVTGLNLATGKDVLAGAELDAALVRIRAHCADHPGDDFFNASLALFRSLGRVGTGRAKER